jgi:hypothetical protein
MIYDPDQIDMILNPGLRANRDSGASAERSKIISILAQILEQIKVLNEHLTDAQASRALLQNIIKVQLTRISMKISSGSSATFSSLSVSSMSSFSSTEQAMINSDGEEQLDGAYLG